MFYQTAGNKDDIPQSHFLSDTVGYYQSQLIHSLVAALLLFLFKSENVNISGSMVTGR